ncbi:hypothetical protein KC19_1G034500 [Ceratodon purpureus]|uniref:C3H1-type domain-containing protein n=3 Tax=Ceratodon purpureus TaxID=3225 RepID=A0A8T0J335_CERPU|nr:hypothetical protein KC19_1G034500 [Ceratodon purpureus]KAG0589624.1 hypothetical protein KC19_1G034500 [Ceratodon purpureus]
MEYYAPAKGAPTSFAAGQLEQSPSPSQLASSGVQGIPAFYDDWQRHGVVSSQHQHHQGSPPGADSASEEAVWPMTMQGQDGMDGGQGPYPERPGEPDCVYYMRTGLCGFGMTCRFNHPPNRKLAAAVARGKGEYPERVGQPECQYYLKTGTCKFGATCKYHHPREKAGSTGRVHLNVLGLPLRQGEKECAYYMRTGSCKYGVTCKFHHPQPATVGALVSLPPYGSGGGGPSSAAAQAQAYPAGVPQWPIARSPYLPPRLQGPSSYGPVMPLPQGIMSMTGWNYQQGPVGPPEGQQHGGYVFGGSPQGEQMSSYAPYMQGSSAMGVPAHQAQSVAGQKDTVFPERPGQPECQYYMKTGDCKFGTTCRYHHPKDRATPSPTCHLSPIGLPLRPGAPPCSFYTRYGICKFGPTCKFDHPLVGGLTYSPSASSLSDMPVAPYPIGSSPTTLAPSSSSDAQALDSSGSLEAVGGYGEGMSGHQRMRGSMDAGIGSSSGAAGGSGSGSNGGDGSSQADSGGKS